MRRLILITSLAIIAAACTSNDPLPAATTSSTTAPETSQAIAPTSVNLPQDDAPCLAGDRPFAASGLISAFGGTSGDATQISGIRWAQHPGCERVVVDLLTADGAPAGALGPIGVDYDENLGIIRINLPDAVARSTIADSLLDGDLVNRAFVVRTIQGTLAVDLHVTPGSSVTLRSFEVGAPSRIVVDIKPQPEAPPVIGATISDDMVVLSPTSGQTQSPILVTGYARAFEAEIVARLHEDRYSPVIAEQTDLAADWAEAWGEFVITFANPPAQPLELFVGSESPSSGDTTGVWISIDTGTAPPPDV